MDGHPVGPENRRPLDPSHIALLIHKPKGEFRIMRRMRSAEDLTQEETTVFENSKLKKKEMRSVGSVALIYMNSPASFK